MRNISELPEDLLVKILLLIPTKEVVATSLLSKRWRSVWKLVPKLDFHDGSYRYHATSAAPSDFITKFLELNISPVLETFHLNLCNRRDYAPETLEKWVNVAVARNVLDLNLLYYYCCDFIPFPMSLYTHETLLVLRLQGTSIENVPSKTCFRSLKTLSLQDMRFSNDQTVERFLSCFPVLEALVIRRWIADNVKTYSICVPSLKSLEVEYLVCGYQDPRYDHGYVINAPCLKYLRIVDHFSGFCSFVNVPERLEAKIQLRFCDSEKLLGSLASARQLSLCLIPHKDPYLKGDFDQLVSQELCVMCSLDWLNIILRHSPKLRALRLSRTVSYGLNLDGVAHRHSCQNSKHERTNWERPSCVPECLMSSLETVEWIAYKGTEEEANVLKYLLENGNLSLKKRLSKVSYEILSLGRSGDGDTTVLDLEG
ncbi:unnamed protein product [Eruca vesicaria subsp. sativa]|uniref:F-box domain-containing protein n=1 Tax=Eruca vesicaria subsp. sativa TaxID=29727 RepID=A0ABC8LPN1_ERUVS|nr:unnamed protein product [Eruca vesicaria subsp. sativa]